jgi:hypothetical protein
MAGERAFVLLQNIQIGSGPRILEFKQLWAKLSEVMNE